MDHEIEIEEQNADEVVFVQDVENKVFQAIVVKTLMKIEGVRLLEEGSLIDDLLGREGQSRIKGVYIEQDLKSHSVAIKIELELAYGLSLKRVAKSVQHAIVKDIQEFSGFNISSVHLVFKHLYEDKPATNEESLEQIQAEEL
jgi:uncharacterized alkaline shock family protein YloU